MENSGYTTIKPVESMNNIRITKPTDRENKGKERKKQKQKEEKQHEMIEEELNEQNIEQNPDNSTNNKDDKHSIDFCA
ncbi:MAG: hypothetical protein FVQ80_05960 [Planctomycetes bacterium]|nr:hypothetical protein [Planctomycetota bacterium]